METQTLHRLIPSTPAVDNIEMTVTATLLSTGSLQLIYALSGNLNNVYLPPPGPVQRADALWQHTCFEAFIRTDHSAYREFNFSPSGQWQAYDFSHYRSGGLLEQADNPCIECHPHQAGIELRATLQSNDLPPGRRLCLGVSAVIETVDGALTYWALRHAPGKPDFHHPDTFILDIDRP